MNQNKSIVACVEPHYCTSKMKVVLDPSYLKLFEFEKTVDPDEWAHWFGNNYHISIMSSILYLITIFWIQSIMKNRSGFDLRRPLFLWNLSLALFSAIGFVRGIPEFIWIFKEHDNGLYDSICRRDFRNGATVFWGLCMAISKVVELGDTLFIVLRKKPLIFLHYYHHISVLVYTWCTAYAINSYSVWFIYMNYGVHAIMYSYFALQALGIKLPKPVSMTITILQLSQMMMGIYVNFFVLYAKHNGMPCDTKTTHVYYAFMMYTSYFILFGIFFRNAYVKKSKTKVQ